MDETHDLIERARRSAEEARRVGAETKRLVRTSREIQHWTARVQGRVAGESGAFFSFNRRSNCLLALLPASEFERLAPFLRGVALTRKQLLYRANSQIDYVYFPISGLLSAAIVMKDGGSIEIATVGNEGMAGLPAFLGNDHSPHDVAVQIPGQALRMDVSAFQAELNRGSLLRDIITGYCSARAVEDAYQIACNGLHNVGQRCCRQLLNIQDRIASDTIPYTHDSLALTLGVRRATVSDELSSLQARGVVGTGRGQITILDRPQLQSLVCECYKTVTKEFVRLFNSTGVGDLEWPPLASSFSTARPSGRENISARGRE
jgi:CRP-like cAMP-binding protein